VCRGANEVPKPGRWRSRTLHSRQGKEKEEKCGATDEKVKPPKQSLGQDKKRNAKEREKRWCVSMHRVKML